MKNYKFKAGTSRNEMIMGLAFPIVLMIPALITLLILETLYSDNITGRATLDRFLMAKILIPSFIIWAMVSPLLKKKCSHQFEVEIRNKQVTVYMDNKLLFDDGIEDIQIKENPQMIKLRVYGKENKAVFIGRGKSNFFGFCTEEDLFEIRDLANNLKEIANT